MRRALLIALVPLLIAAKRHPLVHESVGDGWFFVLPAKARLGLGYQNGSGSLDVEGGAAELAIAARPELRLRTTAARIALDLGYRHVETFGYRLREGRFDAGLIASAKLGAGFRVGAQADLLYVWRPQWLDLYQQLATTDRYTHLDLGGEGAVGWRASKLFAIDLYGGYRDRAYRIDPAYDGVLDPTHVPPFSSWSAGGGARVEGAAAIVRWLADLRLESIRYRYLYARDAITGLTHSGPGDPPSNPLQRFLRLTLREKNRLWIRDARLHLGVGVLYRHNQDTFAGYYTFDDFGGELSLRFNPFGRFGIEADYEVVGRRYGNSSKPEGDRTAAFHRALLRLEYAFWKRRVTPFIEGALATSSTNFPDYVDIDFDYENFSAIGGIELSL